MTAYYNEIDPNAAQWTRELAANGLIPPGDVDTRDIRDVRPSDLAGYTQCHFFAGLSGWPLALDMAGWPRDRRIWSGSCPCGPFSQAGNRLGFADDRHLWPAWHWLIRQCRPVALAGEQVESVDGRAWLDVVSADLEADGYRCGATVLPSAGFGAPNIRHRFFWVADAESRGRGEHGLLSQAVRGRQDTGQSAPGDEAPGGGLGDAERAGLPDSGAQELRGAGRRQEGGEPQSSGRPANPWRELEWIECRDGKRRPTQPGVFPLAPRVPGDVAALRAIGNAINPWPAAEVIRAWMSQT